MRNTHQNELADTFRKELAANAITQDGKLLPLRMLADRYRTSPATVKRIVDKLVAAGVLRTVHGVGIFPVQGEITPIPVMRPHIGAIVLDDTVQVELNKAREAYMEKGWAFSIYNASNDEQSPAREKLFLNMVRHQEFAAVVMEASPIEPTNFDTFQRLRNLGIKVIHLSPYRDNMESDVCFVADFFAAGQLAIAQAAKRQYTRILACNDQDSAPFLRRWEAGLNAMAAPLGIDFTLDFAIRTPEAAIAWLRRHQTPGERICIVCGNSIFADNLIDAMTAAGIACPGDCGVISLSPSPRHDSRVSFLDFDYPAILRDVMQYATNPEIDALTTVQKAYPPFYVDRRSA